MAWNANGLLRHQNELEVVLNTTNIDVCLISETHFTKESYIRIKGYNVYHALHPDNKARGGSAVIVKENIDHYEQFKYEEHAIQSVAVQVKTKRFPVSIASIYSPPRHILKSQQYENLLKLLGNRFVLGGDFNAKHTYWGSRLTTTKGKELLNAIRNANCDVISTGKPTYWPTDTHKIPDLIDFFVYKNLPPNFLHIEDGFDMSSDHSPIILNISEDVLLTQAPLSLANKNTDWISFGYDLDSIINLRVPLKHTTQLESEARMFLSNIQQCVWKNTPEYIQKKTATASYPNRILHLITEKRKQRQKWQRTRFPADKTLLNNLTKRLSREIQNFRDESMRKYLSELTCDRTTDYSLWKATKHIKKPITQIPPIKEENGQWAVNNNQKVIRFANHLEQIFHPNEASTNEVTLDTLIPYDNNITIRLVTPKEISREIKLLHRRKTPGYDLITGEVLQHLPRKAIVKLTTIINATFRLKYVPDVWKVAEVIMIPKPGKPLHLASSYRPISLLPIISKLFEKLLLKRLKPIIEERKLIPNYQFGFREKHSTIDQVHRITDIIEKSLEDKNVCATVFLDVAQAFDKVWHQGLTYKLKKMLPSQFSNLLDSYISSRMFRVRQQDAYSDLRLIRAGVPQGSVLGPVLYLLYTSDIPEIENNTIATFADDTAIMAVGSTHKEAVEKVQAAVNTIFKWTNIWRIKLNESKSIHIDFTNKKSNYHPIFIDNKIIPYQNTAKYLGMTLDAKLRWKAHVKKKRAELELRYKKMYWLLGKHSALSVHNKILLYKQVLMPVWTYGIQLWGCTKKSNTLIIQRFQNKVLRGIVNAPWYIRNDDLHRDLNVDLVANVVNKFAEAHYRRLHNHVNVEAIQLLDNTDIVRRLKRTKPFELV